MPRRDFPHSIPEINYLDESWVAQATIAEQSLFFLLDTGSSDTWVNGPDCESPDGSCGAESVDPIFDPATNAVNYTGLQFTTFYSGGSNVSGLLYSGNLNLAGISAKTTFGVAKHSYGNNMPASGIFGLNFKSLNSFSNGNFMDLSNIKSLSFYFSNWINNDLGLLTINGVDETKFIGPIKYVPSSDKDYTLDPSGGEFIVGGCAIPMKFKPGDLSYVDTGTTLLLVPNTVAAQLNSAIGADPVTMAINCSSAGTSPSITMNFQNISLVLGPEHYIMRPRSGGCFSGIGGMGESGYAWGDTFLRAVYTVFDREHTRIGFAQAVHPRLNSASA
ncbi:hypothetical protein HDU84_006387 [Entophlyctis sp. JEL0112]|nr:hypothetical protein HDU84_006387 [Entophlyctis sp. JEL0112]